MIKYCVECRGDKLISTLIDEPFDIQNKTFIIKVPATKCVSCGATYISHKNLGIIDKAKERDNEKVYIDKTQQVL